MFYAIYRPYGRNYYSNADSLHRFETKAKRDAIVDNEKWDGSYHWLAITAKQARQWFPKAFASFDYENAWNESEWSGNPTGGNYKYM